jgi:hypothetical protein
MPSAYVYERFKDDDSGRRYVRRMFRCSSFRACDLHAHVCTTRIAVRHATNPALSLFISLSASARTQWTAAQEAEQRLLGEVVAFVGEVQVGGEHDPVAPVVGVEPRPPRVLQPIELRHKIGKGGKGGKGGLDVGGGCRRRIGSSASRPHRAQHGTPGSRHHEQKYCSELLLILSS